MAESSKTRGASRANGRKSTRKATSTTPPATKASKTRATKTARATGTGRAAPTTGPKSAEPRITASLSTDERHRMIAEAAYYRAQRRGFAGGNSHQDWLDAEAKVDARLLRRLADD